MYEKFELVPWYLIKPGDRVWYMGHIMTIVEYDAGKANGYLATEYVPGTLLSDGHRRIMMTDEKGITLCPPVDTDDRVPREI